MLRPSHGTLSIRGCRADAMGPRTGVPRPYRGTAGRPASKPAPRPSASLTEAPLAPGPTWVRSLGEGDGLKRPTPLRLCTQPPLVNTLNRKTVRSRPPVGHQAPDRRARRGLGLPAEHAVNRLSAPRRCEPAGSPNVETRCAVRAGPAARSDQDHLRLPQYSRPPRPTSIPGTTPPTGQIVM